MNDTPDLPGAPYDFDEAERSVQYANYRAALNLDLDDAATPDWAVDAAYEVFSPNKAGAVPVTPEHKRDALRRYQAFARSGNPADLFDAGRRAWEEAKKQGTDAAIAYIDAHEKKGGLPELGTIVRDLANNPSARYSDTEIIRAGGAQALAAKDEEDERKRRIREYDAQVAARDKEAIIAACLPRLSPDVRRAFDDFVSNGCRFVDGSFDTLLRAGEDQRELFGALATMVKPSPPNVIGAAAQNLWDSGWRVLWEAPGTLRKSATYTAGSYLGGLLQTGSLGESAALAGDAYAEYKETRRLRRELLAPKLADYGAFGNTLVDAAGIVGYWAPMGVGTRLAKLGRAVDAAAKGADAAATTGRLYAAAGRGVLKTEQALGRGLSPATRSAIAAGAIRAEPLAAAFTPERVALAAYAIEEREQILDRIIEEGGNAASLWTQLAATGAAIGHAYVENIRWEQWAGAGRHAVEVAKANAYAKLAHALPERVGKLLGTDRIVFTKGAREMARSMAALAIGRDIGILTFYEALEEGVQQAIEETTVGLFSPHGLSAEQVLGESWKAFYGSIPSMMLTMGFGTARRARGYSQGIYNAEGDGQLLVDAAAATRDAIRNRASPLSRDVESLAPLYGAWTRATTASDRQKLFAQAGIDAVHALQLDTAFAEISKAATPALLSETFGSGAVAREATRILAADSRLEGMRLATDADTGEERLERELTLPNGKTVTLSVASRRVQNIAELSTATETAFSSAREAFSDDEEIARILADTGIDLRKTLAENLAAFDGDQNALDNAFRTATAGLAVRGAATPVSVETDPETGRTIVKADITLTGWAEEETAYHEYGHALQETLQRLGDMTDEQTAALVADLGAPQDATETWNQERGAVGLERLAREDAPRPIPQRPFFQRVARTLRLRALVRDAEPQIKDALDILETAMRTGKFDGWQARSEAQNRVHAARHAASDDSAAALASAADSAAAPSEGDGAAPTPESTALDKFETNQPLAPAEMLAVRNTLGGNIRDATRSILDGGWRWNAADNLWQHFPTLQGRAPDLGPRYFGADGAWHDNYAPEDLPDSFSVSPRYSVALVHPWTAGFPNVLVHTTRAAIDAKFKADFDAAKAGDVSAAERLVRAVAKTERIKELVARHPGAIVVPVRAEEATGRNKIPSAYAKAVADAGLELDTGIVQSVHANHTGANAIDRLLRSAEFDGPVEAGREYVLVDDHVTQGGTLNELRNYIESRGGKVVEITTLTASRGSTILPIRKATLDALAAKFGPALEDELRSAEITGRVDALTESQGRYLLKLSPDSLRDRVSAAGISRSGSQDGLPRPLQVEESRAAARHSVSATDHDGTVADALPPTLRDAARAVIEERANTPAWMAEPDGRPTLLPERDWLRRESERYSVTRDAAPTPAELEEARRQYDEVVARYTNPDGTKKPGWMKAPNGKTTKLTERQWVQVRTPNFRNNFFGDWLSYEVSRLSESGISLDEARRRIEEMRGRDFVNEETGVSVRLSSDARGKLVSNKATGKSKANGFTAEQHNEVAAKVGDLFAIARRLESRPDRDGDANILSIQRYAAPVRIGEQTAFAWITVKESKQHGAHIYSVEEIKLEALARKVGQAETDTTHAASASTTQILRQLAEKVNPSSVSKVVDENGEPRVMWRGAPFDPLSQAPGKGVIAAERYFTPSEAYARRYEKGAGATRAYFLNVRSPFDVRNARDAARMLELRGGHDFHVGSTGALDWAEAPTAEEIEELWPGEYDGLVLDEGGDPAESGPAYRGESVVPFAGGAQVKSATDNTGVFSARPDVRYSVTPAERAPDAAPGGAGGEVPRSSLPAVRGTRPLDFLRNADTINAQQGNLNVQRAQPEPEPDDEFRRIQVEARSASSEVVAQFHGGQRSVDEALRGRLTRILARRVESGRSNGGNDVRVLTNEKTGENLRIGRVDGQTFHDVFEIVRTYLRNGDAVDIHDSYSDDVKCFLTNDGLSGFAVESDGNIVSVFSLGARGFLRTVAPLILESGGAKLDCYQFPGKTNLPELYSRNFGFKRASSMAYDESFEPEDPARERHGFGERHGMPRIVFMVADPGHAVEEKTFDGDYDGAVAWQNANLPARSRYSISHLYTGSAADYAERVPVLDKDGNVTGYRDDNIRVDHKWVDGAQRYSIVSTLSTGRDSTATYTDSHGKKRTLHVIAGDRRHGMAKVAYKHCTDFGTAWTGGFTLDELNRYEHDILAHGVKTFDKATRRRTFTWKSPEGITFTIGTFIDGKGENAREIVNTVYTDRSYKQTKALGTHSSGKVPRGQPSALPATLPQAPGSVKTGARHSVVPRLWAFDPGRLPSSIRWGTLNGHDGNIVGLVAMSRLAGRRMDSESISQLARRLGVKMSASEIRQKADDLLKGDMADLAARLAGGGDVAGAVAALSAAAEPRTSDHALIRQAFAAGAKRGQAAEKMRSRVASAVLEAQRGADLAEITREFGFDVAAILHSWTNEVEKREGPDKDIAPLPDPLSALSALEDPDGTKAEDAAARLAQTRAEIAERFQQLFAETRRLAKAREELANAREEKEETQAPAAGSVPGAEASGEAAAQNPDDLSDIPGALDPATLPIPYELLAQNGIDLRDAPTFALALRVGIREMLWKQDPAYDGTPFGAGLGAEPLREAEHRLWANPTALDQYRKSMIAILTDMADKLLDHGSVAYRRAREAATHIATDCTADQIERDTADVLRGISQNSIRQTTRATVAELRAELKTGFIDQTTTLDSDYVRKQTGEIGKRAAWIHKVLGMTSGQADAALDALERELATRAALYDEAIKSGDATTLAVDDDQRYREALWKKADLEAYRDTLRLLPGAAKAVCDTIRDWMKTSAAEWARRSIAYERDMERKRAAILEAVRNVREDGSDIVHESDSAADRRYLRFVNTLDQRLRDIFRFSRGDARERADAVRDEWHLKVARATETYETRMQRAQEFFSRAVNDVTGGHGLEWLKHMEEEIPEEQAERLSREGRRHLTYGQILHLYGYLCQTGDYADNIHRHGRDGQRAYIEREVLTPEDIAVFSRLRDYYADTRDEISDAKKEQTGIGFGAADPWYAPVKIATPARDGAPVEASTWNLMPEVFSERRRHTLDVDETADALALFWDRAEESSRMIAYGGLGVEFLHTLCNGKVKAAIRRFHGARELSELLAHVGDTLAGGHSIPGAYRGDDVEWIGRLRTAVTHVALCGNLSPALKQTVSAPVFALARERGIGSVFRDMLSIGTPEWREAYREWSQSDGYRARYGSGGIMGEIKDALTSGRGVASRWQRILSLGYAPIQIGDMIPSLLVGVSTYRTERDALVRRGLDYAEACREAATRAFIATEETQQSSRVENKPAIVRRGDVGIRLFTMFQSASQLQLSWQSQRAREMRGAIDPEGKHDLLWAIVHAGQDERAAHARRKFAEAFFINHLVLPPLFGLVATILNALLGKKPDEKDALALGAGILLGSMTALPLYAYAMYTAFGILTEGKSYIYKGNRTTAPSLFTTADRLVANGLMTGYDLTHGDLDTAMTDADRFMRAAVSPYRTIRKALDNYSK